MAEVETTPPPQVSGTSAMVNQAGRRSANQAPGFICCSRPNGDYIFLPSLLTTTAFILSMITHNSCRFVDREVTVLGGDVDVTERTRAAVSIGIWAFKDPGTGLCFYYPSNTEFDSFFRTSRAMVPLASVVGGLVMVTFWFSSCMGMEKPVWRFCGFILVLVSLFEGLTFLIFRSNFCNEVLDGDLTFDCNLSTGGNMAIASIVFYFAAAVSVCNTPAPRGFTDYHVSTERTETINPDGTKVVQTRAVYNEYP
mmetsp:Transcript_9984/g.14656  ORF Transcript_9984/g.14656 Transcript_9984/m.14656 type:complete len:253 (-) Transcript_9984:42-800(-)